jgi:hypothetical protein
MIVRCNTISNVRTRLSALCVFLAFFALQNNAAEEERKGRREIRKERKE